MVEETALAGLEAPEDRDVEGLGARECAAALQEVPQIRDLVTVAEFRGHIKEQISGNQLCSRQPPLSCAVEALFCTRTVWTSEIAIRPVSIISSTTGVRRARFSAVSTIEIRSEEHTSELQSLRHLVCRLLL